MRVDGEANLVVFDSSLPKLGKDIGVDEMITHQEHERLVQMLLGLQNGESVPLFPFLVDDVMDVEVAASGEIVQRAADHFTLVSGDHKELG